jgi:hypothetical protein
MPDADERRRVLDMLAEGRISADDAAKLLKALGDDLGAPPPPPKPPRTGTARTFRINVDAFDDDGDTARIRVNVPMGLARFASRFLPPEARTELESHGIDLQELLESLGDDPEVGPLVDIDVDAPEGGGKKAKITIEVA